MTETGIENQNASQPNSAKESLVVQRDPEDIDVHENTSDTVKNEKKVGSFNTVFSVWNNMIGSSTVSLPYNVYNAGIIPTIVISIVYGFISFYTCKIYATYGKKTPDFADVVEKYFNKAFGHKIGKIAKTTQIIFNLMVNIGATLIYFLIINQNLYPCLCLLLNTIGIDIKVEEEPLFSKFSLLYSGIIFAFLVFPLTIRKEIGLLVKLSSYGIYFISILIIYVIVIGIKSLFTTNFHFDYIQNVESSKDRYLLLYGENPSLLAGALSLGYFCHSIIMPVLNANLKQENNIRDLFFGYCLVCLTFLSVGIFGYIGFSGYGYKVVFKSNWFLFYDSDNIFILFLRLLNVFQLGSVFPILFFVVRTQLFKNVYGKEYLGKFQMVIFSVIFLFICEVVLYLCHDFLGELLGITGATTALILVYSLPPIVAIIDRYYDGNIDNERNQNTEENKCLNKDINNVNNNNLKLDESQLTKQKIKDVLFIFGEFMIIMTGIVTFVFQFVHVNFFNVEIKNA